MEWASAKEMLREKEPTRETASAKAKAPQKTKLLSTRPQARRWERHSLRETRPLPH